VFDEGEDLLEHALARGLRAGPRRSLVEVLDVTDPGIGFGLGPLLGDAQEDALYLVVYRL
jgi:hypothetical protein